jgi:hypothetical protein
MKYCIRCGQQLNTNAQFCGNCGIRQPYIPPELLDNRHQPVARPPIPPVSLYPQMQQPQRMMHPMMMPAGVPCNALVPSYCPPLPRHKKGFLPFFIWSLILIPFFNPLGTPFGVIASLFCLSADADRSEQSDGKIRKAAILCFAATVIDITSLIVLILLAMKNYKGF